MSVDEFSYVIFDNGRIGGSDGRGNPNGFGNNGRSRQNRLQGDIRRRMKRIGNTETTHFPIRFQVLVVAEFRKSFFGHIPAKGAVKRRSAGVLIRGSHVDVFLVYDERSHNLAKY